MRGRRTNWNKRQGPSKVIALGGIFLALTVIILYAESIVPTGRLSLYALSSFFVSVIVIEAGIYAGWLFYLASSLLAFIIVPDKLGLIPYFVFFGVYGLIKHYTEKTTNRVLEYLLKFVFFNLCLVLAFFLAKEVFIGQIEIKLSPWIVIPALELVFFIYDFVYTLSIETYLQRIRKILF
jgi:hypothetical protein